MEDVKVFEELIRKMETSQLNYKISRTPFSATISVKSSVVKHWDQEDAPPVQVHILSDKVNIELANPDVIKLSEQVKIISDDKVKLEDKRKHE